MTATAILLWVGGLLGTVVLTVILTEPIQDLMASRLSFLLTSDATTLRGIWESTFTYTSQGNETTDRHLFQITQFGKRLQGRNITPPTQHSYIIKGRVVGLYITGTWWSSEAQDKHHGAFQFVVTPDGKKMDGMWLGYDRQNQVRTGPWTWKKLSTSRREIPQLIREHKGSLEKA